MKYIKYSLKENRLGLEKYDLFPSYKNCNILAVLPEWINHYEPTSQNAIYCRLVRVSDDYLWIAYSMTYAQKNMFRDFVISEARTDEEIESYLQAMML